MSRRLKFILFMIFIVLLAASQYGLFSGQNADFRSQQEKQNIQFRNELKAQESTFEAKIVTTQLNGCHRGNTLRRHLNGGYVVIRGFMQLIVNAAKKRAKVDTGAKKALDLANAKLYAAKRDQFKAVPLVNCVQVIEKGEG